MRFVSEAEQIGAALHKRGDFHARFAKTLDAIFPTLDHGRPDFSNAHAKNPWRPEFFNLTEQMKIARANRALADLLQKEAANVL